MSYTQIVGRKHLHSLQLDSDCQVIIFQNQTIGSSHLLVGEIGVERASMGIVCLKHSSVCCRALLKNTGGSLSV